MKNKLVASHSSYLVYWATLAALLAAGVLAAFAGLTALAAILLFLLLIGFVSRLWAQASCRNVSLRVRTPVSGVFPGEKIDISLTLKNDKLLPVLWMDVFFPLPADLCLIPEQTRKPEDWELHDLQERNASEELVGERSFSLFLWYESQTFTSRWEAKHRGICSTEGWRLRTGDGFGLTQVETPLPREDRQKLAVYPKLVPVLPDLFLRNVWNSDTGARGILEDPTVIRSTRAYQTGDPGRKINWRLLARGLPLTVNVYEEILPCSVHFILDGESYSGPEPHPEALEEALSLIASEVLCLAENQVQAGISLSRGRDTDQTDLFPGADAEDMLWALAAYQPLPPAEDDEGHVLPQPPVFDEEAICAAAPRVGHFYYVALDTRRLTDSSLLPALGPAAVTLLTAKECPRWGEFEAIPLSRLKGGESDG